MSSSLLQGGTGGRVTVMQTQLPTVGPGALKSREDPNQRAGGGVINDKGEVDIASRGSEVIKGRRK